MGVGRLTTHDLARCRLAARMVALVYNWWNIFVRLANPDKHLEAITSRPLLLAGIAERTRHGRQTTLRIASTHGRARWAQRGRRRERPPAPSAAPSHHSRSARQRCRALRRGSGTARG